jgi:hypothetical protein
MVDSLPEELLDQAELLLTLVPNQANVPRAVSNVRREWPECLSLIG